MIGDVHAEDESLTRALDRLQRAGIATTLCVGDIADGRGDLGRACEILETRNVITVRGNHDRWLLTGAMRNLPGAHDPSDMTDATRRFLSGLPLSRAFSTTTGPLLLCHGLGDNDMGELKPDDFGYAIETNDDLIALMRRPDVRIVVNGHTHQAMVRQFENLTVVNAGTLRASDEKRRPPVFLILDFERCAVDLFQIAPGGSIERSWTRDLLPG